MLPLVSVLGATVEEARADDGRAIRFKISGGFAIECSSNASYEAWKLEGTNVTSIDVRLFKCTSGIYA